MKTDQEILRAALAYHSAVHGREVRREFVKSERMDGHDVMLLGISFEQRMPGFPNPPRQFRIETWIDGKHKGGIVVSS